MTNKTIPAWIILIICGYLFYQKIPLQNIKDMASFTTIDWIFVVVYLVGIAFSFVVLLQGIRSKKKPAQKPEIFIRQDIKPMVKPEPKIEIRTMPSFKADEPKKEEEKMKKADGFDVFREIIEEDDEKLDISTMGDKLAADFEKTISKMTEQLEKETEELEKKKEKADKINENINTTVKKMWGVYEKLNAHRDILDKKIRANKAMKERLGNIGDKDEKE